MTTHVDVLRTEKMHFLCIFIFAMHYKRMIYQSQ